MLDAEAAHEPFKVCSKCAAAWQELLDLVVDPSVVVTGYQPIFEDAATGLVLLVHERNGCRTTLAIVAGELRGLYQGEIPTELMAGQKGCPRHCLSIDELADCHNACSMAWVRHALQYLRRHELPPHLEAAEPAMG